MYHRPSNLGLWLVERDWIDWLVDVGQIIGGLASLLAVGLALVGLDIARKDRADARRERQIAEGQRSRAESVELLTTLHGSYRPSGT